MESWLGERIRKRLELRKDQLQLALNGQENLCSTQRQSPEEGSTPDAPPADSLPEVANHSAGSVSSSKSPSAAPFSSGFGSSTACYSSCR
jgi:hypothetical protein